MEVLIPVAIVLALVIAAYSWRNRFKETARSERSPFDYCEVCNAPITGKATHRFVDRPSDEDEEAFSRAGGGTAMVAEFCKKHCPGNCQYGCEAK